MKSLSLDTDMQRFFYSTWPPSFSSYVNTGGERRRSQNKAGVLHRYQATVNEIYRQVSNIRRTIVGDKIVDHSDVVGASPVGAAPTTSSLST